jgi:IclR family acetate operon transcriptional repressor
MTVLRKSVATKGLAKPGTPAEREPVRRALELLLLMAESPQESWGVRQLAEAADHPVSSLHRTLSALVVADFVENEGGRYRLGSEAERFSHLMNSRISLPQIAQKYLEDLVADCNESALLGVYDSSQRQMRFVISIESSNPLRYVVPLNVWGPVHAGSSGCAILAFLPEEEQRAILSEPLEALTPKTKTRRKLLAATLAKIKEDGYAISFGERIVGAVGIAAPIFDRSGAVCGDVCVTTPEQRFNKAFGERVTGLVVRCAKEIGRRLGNDVASLSRRPTSFRKDRPGASA